MKRFAQLTLGIAAAAMCGCADAGTSPLAGLVGTMRLAAYNGAPLPVHVDPRLGACGAMIVGGSLTTTSDGHVTFTRSYTTPCTTGSPVSTESRTGLVSVDGTAITVALDASSWGGPAEVYPGTLEGGQLTLHFTVNSLATPLEQTFLLVRQ